MSADFADAAERHWEDASLLLAGQRLGNADQLFCLSAECALKAVMIGLGMQRRAADGAPDDRKYRTHIDALWPEFITFAANRGGAHYVSLLGAMQSPFDDWNVGYRYEARSFFSSAFVAKHQQGAVLTKRCLEQAILDGVVT